MRDKWPSGGRAGHRSTCAMRPREKEADVKDDRKREEMRERRKNGKQLKDTLKVAKTKSVHSWKTNRAWTASEFLPTKSTCCLQWRRQV